MSGAPARPRVLCVDDEPAVLEGLGLHLRRKFEMTTAGSGAQALALLAEGEPPDVVVSDMRMPGMDGATLLTRVRELYPDTIRMLLTGQADLASAIAAVNQGQIFRFLTKPCAPADLLSALGAAVDQRRLILGERLLLEQTLRGSIQALTDVLALTHPAAFGRATRIKRSVSEMLAATKATETWQIEVAAMLSQIGFASLPAELNEKVYFGHRLTPAEEAQVVKVPKVTEQLLGHIPRLEEVRAILAGAARATRDAPGEGPLVARGIAMLRIAIDFDLLEQQGSAPQVALATLRGRKDRYDDALLEAFAAGRAQSGPRQEVREVTVGGLAVGMVLAEDVLTTSGALLVARGYELSWSLLSRLRDFRPGGVREPIRVIVTIQPAETAKAR